MQEPDTLGTASFRVRIRSAEEGAQRSAALRASGRILDAWHTETHLALTPRDGEDVRTLLSIAASRAVLVPRAHAMETLIDGPDRDDVARAAGLTPRELARLLFGSVLEVSFVGFSPGFAYLRGLDPRLHLPRRLDPRPRIPRGSLALAGGFAGIYPSATAGGWNLVGSVRSSLFDDHGPIWGAGDRITFVPASTDRTLPDPETPRALSPDPVIVLEDVRGLAFIEDGGRVGRLHQGVPPSGALLPRALADANRAVGNHAGAAGIERYGALRIAASKSTTIATEDGRAHRLRAGESIDLDWHGRVRAGYVAVEGGIDVPEVLGGRGTHVGAQIGGLGGRALRRGDGFGVGPRNAASAGAAREVLPFTAPLGVIAGPDLGHFSEGSLARLTSNEWRISHRSDRMGTRLEGARLEHHRSAPSAETAPLVQGAIEVPPSGEPIVLGPEHPTTGGYPVLGVLRPADLEAFLSRPLGSTVRFTVAAR